MERVLLIPCRGPLADMTVYGLLKCSLKMASPIARRLSTNLLVNATVGYLHSEVEISLLYILLPVKNKT